MNAAAEKSDKEKAARLDEATPQLGAVLDYLSVHGDMSEEDVETLLGIKRTRVYLLTRQMSERRLFEIIGRDAGKRFRRAPETDKSGFVEEL